MWSVALMGAAVTPCAAIDEAPAYGAESNPTGNPIGGGAGYDDIFETGDVVYVRAEQIDVSGLSPRGYGNRFYLIVPEGVTLAGNRGRDATPGPLIFHGDMKEGQALMLVYDRARVTGLRLRGPAADIAEIDYGGGLPRRCRALWAVGADVEIDNCDISNFRSAGVTVTWSGRDVHIHHNHIHDIHAYPVLIANGTSLVEANLIEWVHHSVSGTGPPDSGYEARYNRLIREKSPASWGEKHASHGFDMHGYHAFVKEGHYPGHIAGDRVHIHHNTMIDKGSTSVDVRIRGVPRELARIHHNWFPHPDPERAVAQDWVLEIGLDAPKRSPSGNLWVHDNVYGPEKKLIEIADQTRPQILFKKPGPPEEEIEQIVGHMPLDIDVNVIEGRELKSVVIEIDDKKIYEGTAAPPAGELVLYAEALPVGSHDLWVTAVDDQGARAMNCVRLHVPKAP
jgi:hypothetical protein